MPSVITLNYPTESTTRVLQIRNSNFILICTVCVRTLHNYVYYYIGGGFSTKAFAKKLWGDMYFNKERYVRSCTYVYSYLHLRYREVGSCSTYQQQGKVRSIYLDLHRFKRRCGFMYVCKEVV